MTLKRFLACLLLLGLLLSAVGCNGTTSDTDGNGTDDATNGTAADTTEAQTEVSVKVLDLIKGGKTEYVIVFSEDASEAIISAANDLKAAIRTYTGASVKCKDDFLGHSTAAATHEILIGTTNREESAAAMTGLRAGEFTITVQGEKLVIGGLTERATENAVARFINDFLKRSDTLFEGCKDGSLSFSVEDTVTTKLNFTVESLTVNGVPITELQIVIPTDYMAERGVAKLLARHLRIYTGYIIPVITEDAYSGDCAIIVGKTKHSTLTAQNGKFVCEVTAAGLEIVSDTQFGYAEAYFEIQNTLLATNKTTVALKTGDRCEGSDAAPADLERKGDLRVMYHNIWGTLNDNERSYLGDRNGYSKAIYDAYKPDVLCMQESWDAYIAADKLLFPWLKANYGSLDNSGKKNYIYYNQDTVELIESGYLKINSGDSGSAWAVFRHRATGELFGVINVHFPSNYGVENNPDLANQRRVLDAQTSVRAMENILEKYPDIPIIHGGDYNSTVANQPISILKNAGLTNARMLTNDSSAWGTHFKGPTYLDDDDTFSFRIMANPKVENAIDHIMLRGSVQVERYHVLNDLLALTASDHLAHFVDLSFSE